MWIINSSDEKRALKAEIVYIVTCRVNDFTSLTWAYFLVYKYYRDKTSRDEYSEFRSVGDFPMPRKLAGYGEKTRLF